MFTSPTLSPAPEAAAAAAGLAPYAGAFGRAQAGHLLRRAMFGPTNAEIDRAAAQGLSATLTQLLAPGTPPPPPVNHNNFPDPNVPAGQTWVNTRFSDTVDVGMYRWPSLRGWYFQNLLEGQFSLMDKMAVFWMNHFGMADVGDHRVQYDYIQMFRGWGAGNLRTILQEITVHPAMLKFLNGRYSKMPTPDENYARELIELFTIRRGPQVNAPGDEYNDYTHYTQQDIIAAAHVLTGWRVRGMWSSEDDTVETYWQDSWHDTAPKQFSPRFGNAVIQNNGPEEYKDLIDLILAQAETSRSIARRLYRFFVFSDIPAAVERDVIEPLAALLRNNDWNLAPALRALLGSQHFFDMSVRGPMIKMPYEYVIGVLRPLGGFGHLGFDLETAYSMGNTLHWLSRNMEQDFLYLPTVSGWPAYYQAPGYFRNWISSTTLQKRQEFVNAATGYGVWTAGSGRPLDFLAFLNSLSNRFDVNAMIQEIAEIFLPRPLDASQLVVLKAALLGDLEDMEWTNQMLLLQDSPGNPDVYLPIQNKLKAFLRDLLGTAEFHLQ